VRLFSRPTPSRSTPSRSTSSRSALGIAASCVAAAVLAAGCTGSSGSPAATSSGHKVSGGNITFAEVPGAPPNYIFPMDSLAYYSTNNLAQFQYLMWRPLYWIGNHSQIVVNQPLSLADPPVYSHGNTVVTISLKHYKWSDGTPVTSRDVVFWINLLRANKVNWGEYAPGFFPDDVTKVAAPSSSQVVLTLNGPVNPQWFTESELTQISPLPQHAWDKTSATGKIGNYDTSTSGARAVYKFLASESTQLRSYATNPLWQVVDGPWKLSSFSPSGLAKFVPNPGYAGPVKPSVASFTEVPYTSESAEYDALRAGQLSYGYVPFTDLAQKGLIQSQGYQVAPWYLWSMNIIPINFHNPAVGHIFQQLYVRQAMQSLIDQPQYVSAVLRGNGAVDNGPVPTLPQTGFLTPLLRQGAYPYSVSRAKSLLSQHGWTVKPGGTSTCGKPGSGSGQCGAGVSAGQALSMNLVYSAGLPEVSQEMQAYKSALSLAGIQLNLSQQPTGDIFSTITPCSPSAPACKWQMAYWGNGWEFAPDYYPSGEVAFSTGAIGNWGSYSNTAMDSKIKATTSQPGSTVFQDWANFTAQQLPMLFMPLSASQISAIKTSLGGAAPQPSAGLAITPESWYLTR
jgi:peptide/nickel transport system substrate-binding protein